MSYTKGPWKAERNSAYWDIRVAIDVYHATIASVWDGDDITPEQQERNATILASAPELLEALKEARDSVAECANYEAQYESHRPERAIRTMKTVEQIDAIIAKAEGRE